MIDTVLQSCFSLKLSTKMLKIKIYIVFALLHTMSCTNVVTQDLDNIEFSPGPTWAPVSAEEIKETLTRTKIIPDALDKAPDYNANILWYDLPMGFGRTLVPYEVIYFPSWFQWPHDKEKLYTFVMTDFHRYVVTVFEQP
nr:PREDICTED: uncharacterized protein LOC109042854 [Bemisia tabaci]XP_018915351.1 PREDICTED: uncharacterized protein LOC109042854 [Bemisia tabaci]